MPVSKRKAAPAPRKKHAAGSLHTRHSILYYRLHALLHTVRTIADFEDQLCTLAQEARSPAAFSESALTELGEVLVEMPSSVYQYELQQLIDLCAALENSSGAPAVRPSNRTPAVKSSRRGAKGAPNRK